MTRQPVEEAMEAAYATPLGADDICDEIAWNDYLNRVGPGRARNALCALKGELKDQRRAKVPEPGDKWADREHKMWLRAQARFEGYVNRRLSEVEALLNAGGVPSSNSLRRGMTALIDTIGKLARAIDETDLEYMLEDIDIVLGNERMTLAEALDEGRFDRR